MSKKINMFKTVIQNQRPIKLEEGVLYILPNFFLSIHKCACGCGQEVIVSFNKGSSWKYYNRNGKTTFYPSIGCGKFKCRSHYWIEEDKVIWYKNFPKKSCMRKLFENFFNKK